MSLDLWTNNTDDGWTDSGLGALNYREGWGSGSMSFAKDTSSLERIFYIDFDEWEQFFDDVLGWSYFDGSLNIKRVLPEVHPLIDTMYAVSLTAKPKGRNLRDPDNDFIAPPFLEVTVNYEPLYYDVLSDDDVTDETERYITRDETYNTEFIQLTGGVKLVTSGRVLGEAPGLLQSTSQLIMHWHEVPAIASNPFKVPNASVFRAMQGKVNDATFEGNPAGTVLYVGCEPKRILPKRGSDTYYFDFIHTFMIKDNGTGADGTRAGWNHIYDVQTDRFDKYVSNKTGNVVYQSGDFSTLFVISGF